jgi:DNA-cytosine methyltransferase
MNVLSLFDGMSCGMIALDRLGIKVDNYYASEIDKYAIQVSQANYPDIVQLGDVTNWQEWDIDWATIDLVTGGFPCQSWSLAGKQLGDKDERGMLFWVMLDIIQKVMENNPNAYYLMENVKMKKEFEEYITMHTQNALPNVYKYFINSSLVSAQSRQRYYWTNIPNVEQPKERGIVLRDILEANTSNEYLAGENLQKNYKGGNQLNPNYKSQANTIHDVDGKSGTICAGTHGYANGYVGGVDPKYHLSDKAIAYMNRGSEKYTGKKTRAEHYIKHESEKSKTLTANMHKGVPYGVIAIDKPKHKEQDHLKQFKIKDETVPKYVPNEEGDFCDPYNKKMIKGDKSTTLRTNSSNGNTWIKQTSDKPQHIGTAVDVNGHDILKRVYSPDGKSPTLNTCGGGNTHAKVVCGAWRGRYNQDGSTSQKLELRKDNKTNTITTVQKDNVLTKDEVYWRKLTPLECMRLQTVQDDYLMPVSNTQKYKLLGNGWTIEVIAHILQNMDLFFDA